MYTITKEAHLDEIKRKQQGPLSLFYGLKKSIVIMLAIDKIGEEVCSSKIAVNAVSKYFLKKVLTY
jgi:hypothetical protein